MLNVRKKESMITHEHKMEFAFPCNLLGFSSSALYACTQKKSASATQRWEISGIISNKGMHKRGEQANQEGERVPERKG